jgi:hypothetical protein
MIARITTPISENNSTRSLVCRWGSIRDGEGDAGAAAGRAPAGVIASIGDGEDTMRVNSLGLETGGGGDDGMLLFNGMPDTVEEPAGGPPTRRSK